MTTPIVERTTVPPPGGDAPRLVRLSDLLGDWERDAEAARDDYMNGVPRGPVTGLPKLDRELGGCLQEGLNVVHGAPGSGKSAFALQLAGTCGCPALVVTCEMWPLELLRRHTARITGMFLGRLKNGELEPRISLELARKAIATAPQMAIADATRSFASPEWIRQAAEATRGTSRHFLIILDSVHSWCESLPGDIPEYDRLNAAIASLRTLSSTLACPVVAIAERNRASMSKGGLNASASTRKFEYSAETVIDLGRDEDAREDAGGEVPITLILSKNRNGAAGRKVSLKFHGALQRFREA